jgi:cob(I)alamin adenosyltransferase
MVQQGFGRIQVFTGDGKGKTTAALGTAIRAAAIGKRIIWIAFDKGGESHYSERTLIRTRLPEITLHVTGLDRIHPTTHAFRFGVTTEDQIEGERGLTLAQQALATQPDLLVLDEINSTTSLGIVKESDVLDLLDQKPTMTELILTGRNAPDSFLDRADLVTEMKLVKHYFYHGIKAREGLDF